MISVGCNKTQISEETTQSNEIVLKTTNSDLESLLVSNSFDKKDEAINRQHLALALVMKGLGNDKEFVRVTTKIAKENKGGVQFKQLFASLPRVQPLFEAVLKTAGSSNLSSSDDGVITYEGYLYTFIIFVPNYEVADGAKPPIVSPGFVEYDDIPNNNPDIVYAWQMNPDGSATEVLIGENEAMGIDKPVMLPSLETVGNTFSDAQIAQFKVRNQAKADEFIKDLSRRPAMGDLDALQIRALRSTVTDKFRIETPYGYDTSPSSEFTIDAYRIDPTNGATGQLQNIKNGKPGGSWYIDYVHYRDLGRERLREVPFADFMPTTNIFNTLFARKYIFNCYERDWYCWPKGLGSATTLGLTIYPDGRRKFHHEWYAFVPDNSLPVIPIVASAFQNTNATVLFDYPENQPNMPEKGFLRFTFK